MLELQNFLRLVKLMITTTLSRLSSLLRVIFWYVHCSRQNDEMNAISGTIGVVDISRFASYGYDQRLEVLGPGGMLQVENESPNSAVHYTAKGISK